MANERKCNIPGCEEQIDPKRLSCKKHWQMASDETRQRVMTAWRSYYSQQCDNSPIDERRRRGENLKQAQEQFVLEVVEKEKAAKETPA